MTNTINLINPWVDKVSPVKPVKKEYPGERQKTLQSTFEFIEVFRDKGYFLDPLSEDENGLRCLSQEEIRLAEATPSIMPGVIFTSAYNEEEGSPFVVNTLNKGLRYIGMADDHVKDLGPVTKPIVIGCVNKSTGVLIPLRKDCIDDVITAYENVMRRGNK